MVPNCGVATISQRTRTTIANPGHIIGIPAKVPGCDSATRNPKNIKLNQLTRRKYNQERV